MWKLMLGAVLSLVAGVAHADPITAIIGSVTSALGAGGLAAAAGATGGLLSKLKKKSAAAPAAPKAVMPTADDDAVREAKRRQIAELQARGGRASTVLTDDNKLGG